MFLVVPSVAARGNRRKRVHEVAPAAEVWGLLVAILRPTEMAPNARDDLREHGGGVGMATGGMDESESDNTQLHMTVHVWFQYRLLLDFCFQDGSYEYTGHRTRTFMRTWVFLVARGSCLVEKLMRMTKVAYIGVDCVPGVIGESDEYISPLTRRWLLYLGLSLWAFKGQMR